MKKILTFLLLIFAICAAGYIYLTSQGHSIDGISNMPKTIDLRVDCGQINNVVFGKSVNATVFNSSDRVHDNVMIKVSGYDASGNVTKVKTSTFKRTIQPHSQLSKPITFPNRVV